MEKNNDGTHVVTFFLAKERERKTTLLPLSSSQQSKEK
jgi:hypothetical protein